MLALGVIAMGAIYTSMETEMRQRQLGLWQISDRPLLPHLRRRQILRSPASLMLPRSQLATTLVYSEA